MSHIGIMWKYSLVVFVATSVISEDVKNRRLWAVARDPTAEDPVSLFSNVQTNDGLSAQAPPPNDLTLQLPNLQNEGATPEVPQVPSSPPLTFSPEGAQNGPPAFMPPVPPSGVNSVYAYYPSNILPNSQSPSAPAESPNALKSALAKLPSNVLTNGPSKTTQHLISNTYFPLPNYAQYPTPNLQVPVPYYGPQNTGPVQGVPAYGPNPPYSAPNTGPIQGSAYGPNPPYSAPTYSQLYPQPNVQPNQNCQNTEVLLKVWTIFSNLLDTGGIPVETPDAEQIKFALTLIKKYLEESPQNVANVDLSKKLLELETDLLKNKGVILTDDRPLSNLLSVNPVQVGPSVSFKYELPTNMRPACRTAFLRTIEMAQENYRNLAKSPVCTGSADVPQPPNNGHSNPAYAYNMVSVPPTQNPFGSPAAVGQITPAKSDNALKTILDYLKNYDSLQPKGPVSSLPTNPYVPVIDTTKGNPYAQNLMPPLLPNLDPPHGGILIPNDLAVDQPQTPMNSPTGPNVGQPQTPYYPPGFNFGQPQSPYYPPGYNVGQPQTPLTNPLGYSVGKPQPQPQPQSPFSNPPVFNAGQPPTTSLPEFNLGQPQSLLTIPLNLGQPQSPYSNPSGLNSGQPLSPFNPGFNVGPPQSPVSNPTTYNVGQPALPMNPAFNLDQPQGPTFNPTPPSIIPPGDVDISKLLTPNSPTQNDFPSYLNHVKNIADKLNALNPNQNVFRPGNDYPNTPLNFNSNPPYNPLEQNPNMLQNVPLGSDGLTISPTQSYVTTTQSVQDLNVYSGKPYNPDFNNLNPYGTNNPLSPYQNPYQTPFDNSMLTNPNNYQFFPDKVPTNDLNTIANIGKLNPTTKGEIELTYVLKRPKPLVYQPFYFVKYRLPYNSFVKDMGRLMSQNSLRTSKEDLYKNLIEMYNASEVPSDLAHLPKEQVKDMVLKTGALVNARLIPSNDTEDDGVPVDNLVNNANVTLGNDAGNHNVNNAKSKVLVPLQTGKGILGIKNVRVKRNFITDTALGQQPHVEFKPSIYQTGIHSEPLSSLNSDLKGQLYNRPASDSILTSSILSHV